MEVSAELTIVGDDGVPIAIGLGSIIHALQHILLHLGQHISITALSQGRHLLAHDLQGHVSFLRFHRTNSLDHDQLVKLITLEIGLSATSVGSTGILTDLLQVDHLEQLSSHISQNGILQVVLHILVGPDHGRDSLRCFHLTLEAVLHVTFDDVDELTTLLHITAYRQ